MGKIHIFFKVDSKVNNRHNIVTAGTLHISEYRNISFQVCIGKKGESLT